jgi:UDP-N-acetylmuramoyl-tripeptide--D-alanyl-D-alanine ligase
LEIQQLHTLFLQCHSVCTDTRKISKNDMFFALKGDNFDGNIYAEQALNLGATFVVIDDSKYYKNTNTILVSNVLETLQELAAFHRTYLGIPIIALTGSNGKTTTKELINAVLSERYNTNATKGNLNNHIGVPLTLLSMNKSTEIGIVEMGANHLKEIDFLCNIAKPDYGYITNFGKAHLEGFGSVEGVIKGKSEMYDHLMQHNKTIFVNVNDPIQIQKTKGANIYTFGNEGQAPNVSIHFSNAQPFVTCIYHHLTIESQLIGDYNFSNIAAAIAIGNYFKVDDPSIKRAIENYVPANNRSQIINKDSNKIILDAYNANPTSMAAALHNLEKQAGYKIAIIGDMFELGDKSGDEHQQIASLANALHIDSTIFVGENFYKAHIDSSKSSKYKSFSEFKESFNPDSIKNVTILIKGSRGMAMERILEIL